MAPVSLSYVVCLVLLQFEQARINHHAAQNEAANAIYKAK